MEITRFVEVGRTNWNDFVELFESPGAPSYALWGFVKNFKKDGFVETGMAGKTPAFFIIDNRKTYGRATTALLCD